MEKEVLDKEQKRREFITTGNMFKVVLYISLPLILLNAFNFLYGIIDTIVLAGKGGNVLSSVVMIDQIKNLLSSIGTGLATGGSIAVSRLIGKQNYAKAKSVSNTLICVSVAVAVVLVAVILPLSRVILRLANFSEELIEIGLGYFIIQIITVGVGLFNQVFLGLEKSRGSTQNVLYINLIAMTVKILLTLLFVYVFHFDTMMVAVATLISTVLISVIAVGFLGNKKYVFRFSIYDTLWKDDITKTLGRLSFPVFLGKFVFCLGKVIVNALARNYGNQAPGALGVSNQLGGSVTNITGSIEESSSVIISQNVAVHNKKRVIDAFWKSFIVNMAISIVGVMLLVILNSQIIGFFSNDDKVYADLISRIFFWERLGIIPLAITASVTGLIYGLGYTKLGMWLNLSRLFAF
ncbi:MAG: MATE family efflux transporter, partial [Clostridia bacterium]